MLTACTYPINTTIPDKEDRSFAPARRAYVASAPWTSEVPPASPLLLPSPGVSVANWLKFSPPPSLSQCLETIEWRKRILDALPECLIDTRILEIALGDLRRTPLGKPLRNLRDRRQFCRRSYGKSNKWQPSFSVKSSSSTSSWYRQTKEQNKSELISLPHLAWRTSGMYVVLGTLRPLGLSASQIPYRAEAIDALRLELHCLTKTFQCRSQGRRSRNPKLQRCKSHAP